MFDTVEAAYEKDLSKIVLVLEYNGPWHYKYDEIRGYENELAVPYKKDNSYKYTKKEVYELDKLKIAHIEQYAQKILIYWEKFKELEQIK